MNRIPMWRINCADSLEKWQRREMVRIMRIVSLTNENKFRKLFELRLFDFLIKKISGKSSDSDAWPELHRFIRTSLSSNKSHKQTALHLIGYLTNCPKWNNHYSFRNCESPLYEWASVKDLIVDNLLCSDSTLREPAMKALGKFVNLANDDQGMMEIMERMTPVVLQV